MPDGDVDSAARVEGPVVERVCAEYAASYLRLSSREVFSHDMEN